MESPQLFGLGQNWYFEAARAMLIPTLGFCFLYLLDLPLKSLPILNVEDYSPPRWLVPIFALGSLFLLALVGAVFVSMHLRTQPADLASFSRSYHLVRKVDLRALANPHDAISAIVRLEDLDNSANFQIFVNGVRVFSSTSHCMLESQCVQRDPNTEQRYRETQKQLFEAFQGGARSR